MTLWIVFILLPILLGLWAQMRVKSAFGKWSQVPASSGVTGARAAQEILDAAGIHDVDVVQINSMLGDHYDPAKKRLCLSDGVYNSPSVAALGIAAHECGHAIQHARAYAPLKWRMLAIPATVTATNLLNFLMIAGLVLSFIAASFAAVIWTKILMIACICLVIIAIFQLITLPVEFDASRRAKVILQQMGMIRPGNEATGVNAVLDAAALTYVAALVAVLSQLAYYLMLLLGNRR